MPEMAGAGFGSSPAMIRQFDIAIKLRVCFGLKVLVYLLEGIMVDLVESDLFGSFPLDSSGCAIFESLFEV